MRFIYDIEKLLSRKIPVVYRDDWYSFGVKYNKYEEIVGLYFNNCSLIKIPESIGDLTSLEVLSLRDNRLTTLPDSIGNLKSVRELILDKNSIRKLPEAIGNLKSLRYLSIKDNDLRTIANSIGNLESLHTLNLNLNYNLETLPESLVFCKNLKRIEYEGCNFDRESRSIINKMVVGFWYEFSAKKIIDETQSMKEPEKKPEKKPEKVPEISEQEQIIKDIENVLGQRLENSWGFTYPLSSNQNDSWSYSDRYMTIDNNVISLSIILKDKKLPDSISKLKKLKELCLSYIEGKELPNIIENLQSLEILNLKHNNLEKLPEFIGKFKSLKILNLIDNNLKSLPNSLSKLKSLESLNLSRNKLNHIPSSIAKMTKLKELDLSDNLIMDFPKIFTKTQFNSLEILRINENKLTKIPIQIKNMKNLITLEISDNELKYLPKFIQVLKSLRTLDLSKNKINKIHESIIDLKSLKTLDLSKNSLKTIPESIGRLKNLRNLHLNDNNLIKIPESIGEIKDLEELNLTNNLLIRLPNNIQELRHIWPKFKNELPNLHFRGNPWDDTWKKHFSKKIFKVNGDQAIALYGLYDSRCGFTFNKIGNEVTELRISSIWNETLPESIGNLTSLKVLYSIGTQLNRLPFSFENLTELRILNLEANRFKEIPSSIWNMKKLKLLDLFGNPLDQESKALFEEHKISKILEHCRKRVALRIFLSYKWEESEYFHIKDIARHLEEQDEVYKSYYCERDTTENIDKFMKETIPKCQILLFFASEDSIYHSEDCIDELNLAYKNSIRVIPIKIPTLNWQILSKLGQKLEFEYDLGRNIGFQYDKNNFNSFCLKLSRYIRIFRREVDLLKTVET